MDLSEQHALTVADLLNVENSVDNVIFNEAITRPTEHQEVINR